MKTLQLVSFLMESAEELIIKGESVAPTLAGNMLDEAEELLTLGANILSRHKVEAGVSKEAA